MSGRFARIAAWAATRRRAVVAATIFVALIGVAASMRLDTDASTGTLVDKGSETYHATERLRESFGDDAIAVLVKGDLRNLVLTENLGHMLELEGCLAGQAGTSGQPAATGSQPAGQAPAAGTPPAAGQSAQLAAGSSGLPAACERLAELDTVRVVYGPATFLNQAVIQAEQFLGQQAQASLAEARAAAQQAAADAREQGLSEAEQRAAALRAGELVLGQFQQEVLTLGVEHGLTGPPRLDDPRFVSQVVFDSRLGGGEPKSRFAYLFPTSESALISVRLEPGLDSAARAETISQIREAVGDEAFALDGGSYVVSGVPVVLEELAGEFRGEIFLLLAGALAVMAIVLTLIFGPPLRLLPLGVALVAAAAAFGLLSLAGGSLTMASIAVLPVLIGLAVDYAIQFQARYREAAEDDRPSVTAARQAAGRGGPVITTAALATAAGLLALVLSPIPMVRGFGVLLVVGIALALATALTTGFALLTARRRAGARDRDRPGGPGEIGAGGGNEIGAGGANETAAGPLAPLAGRVAAIGRRARASRVAGRIMGIRASLSSRLQALRDSAGRRLADGGKRVIAMAIANPGRILAVALVFTVGGWLASTRTDVASDLRELVPAGVLDRAGVEEIQAETGVSGELNVIVTADDVTDPEVIAWMANLKQRILERGGFGGQYPSCEAAQICPQIALSDLFTSGGEEISRKRVRAVLAAVPPYFSQAVITRDPQTGEFGDTANIAFGIRVMPLAEQKVLVDAVRAEIDPPGTEGDPPAGVEASVAGLPALAADANEQLSDSRYWLALVGLAAVALVLLAVYRSPGRALVPLVPIVLATGWAALLLWAMGIELNPMSATLGALVIAIATEFSVILSARFREERESGHSVGEALRRTYARTGVAVLASGVTTIAGFAVLVLSDIRMLRDFGFATVVDLTVALVGVMVVLPATLVLAEGGAPQQHAAAAKRRLRRVVPDRLLRFPARLARRFPTRPARRQARGG